MKDFTFENCEKENIKEIIDGVNNFNLNKVPAISGIWEPIEFVVKNKEQIGIAGILGGIGYWNGLEIKALWVHEKYRNIGIGTWILKQTEKIAKEKGAQISMLDTFDFQAEKFYLKNGYETIGEIKDFPKGHRRIYLFKKLTY